MALPSRTVIREPDFEEELRGLLVDVEEADEFTSGAEYVLALYPESGLLVSSAGSIWYLPMNLVRGRRVSLFYTFDEQTVRLLSILAHDD